MGERGKGREGEGEKYVDKIIKKVIPAQAGTHPSLRGCRQSFKFGWVPAFLPPSQENQGMT